MKHKITRFSLLLVLSISVFALQVKMPAPVFDIVFDLDGTVRCLGSGTTTVPATRKEGRPIIISLDNTAGTEYAYIRSTDSLGKKPTAITSSNAQWVLMPGSQLELKQISNDPSKPDARHYFATGSGKIRVVGYDIIDNVVPHS